MLGPCGHGVLQTLALVEINSDTFLFKSFF